MNALRQISELKTGSSPFYAVNFYSCEYCPSAVTHWVENHIATVELLLCLLLLLYGLLSFGRESTEGIFSITWDRSYMGAQHNFIQLRLRSYPVTTGHNFLQFRSVLVILAIASALISTVSRGQITAFALYSKGYQNQNGVADTASERLLAQRAAIRGGYDAQALEGAVDPNTYKLGPGDGIYLNVYSAHSLDQDLTVTPEGRLLVPRIGQVSVNGLSVSEAEKKMNEMLASSYKNPNASLSLRKLRNIKISILGDIVMPGIQTVTALNRVSEAIDKSGGFHSTSSIRNIQLLRADGSVRATADLVKYFAIGSLADDPLIESGDIIMVPRATKFIAINGAVVNPGRFEFRDGDKLSTLIALAKGLLPAALTDSVEIARYGENSPSRAERFFVNLAQNDIDLHEGDIIFIRAITQYHEPRIVSVAGEVAYPGRYSIELGVTRLSELLARAGGLLPTASVQEAALIRRVGVATWESEPEFHRLQALSAMGREQMSNDEYNYYVARTRQLSRTTMVVDFQKLLAGDASQDIMLRDEDSLYVPRELGYVNVSGSVNNQGNVVYQAGADYRYYITKAGGFTAGADKGEVRIINSRTSSYIDPTSDRYEIGPGDTIVIPGEQSNFWKNFQTTSTIISSIITIVAGVLILFPRK